MIQRCTNPNHPKYAIYGARGIAVCQPWRDFVNFYADMGQRPEGLTLERIDVDGNYEPGNCRWATRSAQQYNRRKRRGGTSRFIGVCWAKRDARWRATVKVNGKQKSLGHFDTEEQAARARDAYFIKQGIEAPLNYPDDDANPDAGKRHEPKD